MSRPADERRRHDAPSEHRAYAPQSVGCGVLTVSDTRSVDTDKSGKLIVDKLVAAGHRVALHEIVRDEPDAIRGATLRMASRSDVDAVIVTGGTGVSSRDVTPDTLEPLFVRRLDGFGELFRRLSLEEIGVAAVLSRAVAGTIGGRVVYVTPGSSGAVALAVDRLILPELAHTVGQLRRR